MQVFAEFASAAGESGVREARLWVDGAEVTGGAAVSAIRISYALPGDFPTGTHEARVVVVDALGRAHEKTWSFEVTEARPELIAFFTDDLTVVLDALPRRTRFQRLSVSGTSLPDVEIELRRDGLPVARTETGRSGRFSLPIDLSEGDNELTVSASRPLSGEEGRQVRVRLLRTVASTSSVDADPREAEDTPGRVERGGGETPEGPSDRSLPGDPETGSSRGAELAPAGRARGGREAPDAPGDREPPGDGGEAVVVITKPGDGDSVQQGRVTVLGRAPAGWQVRVRVNGVVRGSDTANPAGHFTMPQVRLGEGANELVAEAEEPATGRLVLSEPVLVDVPQGEQALTVTTQVRRNQAVRDGSWRLEGRAHPGAELEVEVNGRLVLTELVGRDGRFAVQVPLEAGLNRVFLESFEPGSGRSERSPALTLRRVGTPRRGQTAVVAVPPLERPRLPGRGSPSRLSPLK